eukprot:TRINITY_DN5703_c0_g1_i1.p1 TRINITY_DN5703_c0_g1~~TRINITY_DN5703_c0_g1_i1.p1  ORF type:complete len:183 (-),score=14.86 TRINITY_DN5703_c0_g1_i1:158-676(-)
MPANTFAMRAKRQRDGPHAMTTSVSTLKKPTVRRAAARATPEPPQTHDDDPPESSSADEVTSPEPSEMDQVVAAGEIVEEFDIFHTEPVEPINVDIVYKALNKWRTFSGLDRHRAANARPVTPGSDGAAAETHADPPAGETPADASAYGSVGRLTPMSRRRPPSRRRSICWS